MYELTRQRVFRHDRYMAMKYEALNPYRELDGRLHRLRQALAPIEAELVAHLEDAAVRLQIHSLFRHHADRIHDAFAEAADPEANVTTFSDPAEDSGAHPSELPSGTAAPSDRPGL